MGGMGGVSAAVYTAGDYIMLLGIILSSVLVIVALISVISALAKSVKEATNIDRAADDPRHAAGRQHYVLLGRGRLLLLVPDPPL